MVFFPKNLSETLYLRYLKEFPLKMVRGEKSLYIPKILEIEKAIFNIDEGIRTNNENNKKHYFIEEYDLSVMSDEQPQDNTIQIKCTENGIQYKVAALKEENIISWKKLLPCFPRKDDEVLALKEMLTPTILYHICKAGHIGKIYEGKKDQIHKKLTWLKNYLEKFKKSLEEEEKFASEQEVIR